MAKRQRCNVIVVMRSAVSRRAVGGSKRLMLDTNKGGSANPSITAVVASMSAVEPPKLGQRCLLFVLQHNVAHHPLQERQPRCD